MPDAVDIKSRIEAAIPGAQAEVEDWTGGGDHFRATVVVYRVFGEEIGGPIHALSLTTHSE